MRKLLIFFILLMTIPSAFAQWYYNSRNIVTNINVYSDAEVIPLAPGGYIESATINMTFFPKQTESQELLKFYTNPQAEFVDNKLKFTWESPQGKINFGVNANVKTANTITEIKQKINFPIESLPDSVVPYTKPSQTIDSNDENIIQLASELVKGEDDLYSAVFKIADWTKNNINYNLSTLTAEVSQKASWVLQNRQGVCDELTSLFIALLRDVGIPARFVSGVVYTNSPLSSESWGPHGWAEVYFPEYGWVPFDVTYGEFGWVDPTHIKFRDSLDSNEPTTHYHWLGKNADLKTRKLEVTADLVGKEGYIITPLSLEASPLKKAVNFGSYNLIEATIENLNDFYYATEIYLSKPKEVKVIGSESKSILLLPREKKKIFWVVKLDDSLNEKYSYTPKLIVSTLDNISSETSFIANVREKYVSFEEVNEIAKLLEQERERKYSGNVELNCMPSKDEFYEYEDVKVYCNVNNAGNIFLNDADVCFENKCEKISLGISQAKKLTFDIDKLHAGYRGGAVTLKSGIASKASYINLKINDAPKIEIEKLEFPLNTSYDQNFSVYFTLAKKSFSNPKNVEVVFAQNGIEIKWNIGELTENRKIALRFEGNQLEYGKNDYKINVNYYDGLKKQYNVHKEFSIGLFHASLKQSLSLSFNSVGNVVERIGIQTIALMLLVGSIAFIVVVLLLFRKSRRE